MDPRARRWIVARRARFVAAAVATLGAGCTPSARPSGESGSARAPAGGVTRAAGSSSSAGHAGIEPISPGPSVNDGGAMSDPGSGLADADGDGVPDHRDACPNVRGVDGVDSLSAGCPARPCLTILPPGRVELHVRFHFESGRSELSAADEPVLDDVARALDDHPEIQLEIVGHTDIVEPEQLALARAERVRAALASRGVSPARLAISSEGDKRPAAENSTAEGRAKNRRVELVQRGPRTPLRSP